MALAVFSLAGSALGQEVIWFRDGVAGHSSKYGNRLASAGDFDSDGVPDLMVGEPGYDAAGGVNNGLMDILSGSTGELLWFVEGLVHESLGLDIRLAGDGNGDGVDDYFVGLLGYPSGGGQSRVHLYSGEDQSLLRYWDGPVRGSGFGALIRRIGDVDDDGVRDHLVSSHGFPDSPPYRRGRVYVYSGADGTELYHLDGEQAYDSFGDGALVLSDLDGDGVEDFLVGASGYDNNRGRLYVFSARQRTLLYTVTGMKRGLAMVGDQNGDGYDDFLAGELRVAAVLYSGRTGDELHRWPAPPDAGSSYGHNNAGTGDVNGDGFPDFFIGDYLYGDDDNGGENRGRGFLYSGRTKRLLYVFEGDVAADRMGARATALGDVNQDGLGDIAVTAISYGHTQTGDQFGRVYAFAGNDLYLQPSQTTASPGETVALAVRGGDTNALTLLAVVEADDSAFYQSLVLTNLDPHGELSYSGVVPPSLSGHELGFQAYSVKDPARGGGAADSAVARVVFE